MFEVICGRPESLVGCLMNTGEWSWPVRPTRRRFGGQGLLDTIDATITGWAFDRGFVTVVEGMGRECDRIEARRIAWRGRPVARGLEPVMQSRALAVGEQETNLR